MYEHVLRSGAANLLVARQPIVDRAGGVVAYELLARRRLSDVVWRGDGLGGRTTARVIAQAFLDMDVWSITEGLPAYINFPREMLVDGTAERLPADLTVVEILETVRPDPEVRRACLRLRAAGYRLALDDVVAADRRLGLLDVVDVVKLDVTGTSRREREFLLERCHAAQVQVLAEKVETPQQQAEAAAIGCDLFQGYFFQKPAVVDGRRPSVARLQHLQLLRAVLDTPIDRDAVSDVLARDPGAVERLAVLVDALAGPGQPDGGVRDRLRRLTDEEVVRFVALLVVLWLAERRPPPLRDTALIRARFSERLIAHLDTGTSPLDGFLVGLTSLLDALVDEPLADVLGRIHPPPHLADSVQGRHGTLGAVLGLVETYEHGDWDGVRRRAARLHLDDGVLGPLYLDCLAWTRRIVAAARAGS